MHTYRTREPKICAYKITNTLKRTALCARVRVKASLSSHFFLFSLFLPFSCFWLLIFFCTFSLAFFVSYLSFFSMPSILMRSMRKVAVSRCLDWSGLRVIIPTLLTRLPWLRKKKRENTREHREKKKRENTKRASKKKKEEKREKKGRIRLFSLLAIHKIDRCRRRTHTTPP